MYIITTVLLKIVGGAENVDLLSSLKLLRGGATLISSQHYLLIPYNYIVTTCPTKQPISFALWPTGAVLSLLFVPE